MLSSSDMDIDLDMSHIFSSWRHLDGAPDRVHVRVRDRGRALERRDEREVRIVAVVRAERARGVGRVARAEPIIPRAIVAFFVLAVVVAASLSGDARRRRSSLCRCGCVCHISTPPYQHSSSHEPFERRDAQLIPLVRRGGPIAIIAIIVVTTAEGVGSRRSPPPRNPSSAAAAVVGRRTAATAAAIATTVGAARGRHSGGGGARVVAGRRDGRRERHAAGARGLVAAVASHLLSDVSRRRGEEARDALP